MTYITGTPGSTFRDYVISGNTMALNFSFSDGFTFTMTKLGRVSCVCCAWIVNSRVKKNGGKNNIFYFNTFTPVLRLWFVGDGITMAY